LHYTGAIDFDKKPVDAIIADSTMSVLELKNITHSFSGSKKILDNLSLVLEKGNIYGLMGANGSGKTTLFNIITGFIRPTSGDIFFNSKRITRLPAYKINRTGIGRTFQDLRLISKLSVTENVLLAMNDNPTQVWYKAAMPEYVHKSQVRELTERAEEIIATCFLTDIQNNPAAEISYGQQKLLNVACCLANNAQLILLDEPIAGINPNYRDKITGLLKKLGTQGKTIFLIEHNTEFLQEIGDQFYFLRNGKLNSYETFVKLREDREVLDAYLSI